MIKLSHNLQSMLTKKANESMVNIHIYKDTHNIFRLFTVYGPWVDWILFYLNLF